jgi:hypothetical protein
MTLGPAIVFTPYNFLHNLQTVPKKLVFVPSKAFKPPVMQHSSSLGTFVSYKENTVPGVNLITHFGVLC